MTITVADLEERGARLVVRDWGAVVLTKQQRNNEGFRKELQAWLDTAEGAAWVAAQRDEGHGGKG